MRHKLTEEEINHLKDIIYREARKLNPWMGGGCSTCLSLEKKGWITLTAHAECRLTPKGHAYRNLLGDN